jgi:hypothetical protein
VKALVGFLAPQVIQSVNQIAEICPGLITGHESFLLADEINQLSQSLS